MILRARRRRAIKQAGGAVPALRKQQDTLRAKRTRSGMEHLHRRKTAGGEEPYIAWPLLSYVAEPSTFWRGKRAKKTDAPCMHVTER